MKKITFKTGNSVGHIEVPDNMSNDEIIAMLSNQEPEEPLPLGGITFKDTDNQEDDEEMPIEEQILQRDYEDEVTETPLPPAGIEFEK